MNFKPLLVLKDRIESSKADSDTSYFYDLITYSEVIVKITALFLVSNLEDDVDRTRYRYEYGLVRADGIGDFARTISEIITGSASDLLVDDVTNTEKIQLQSKWAEGSWQDYALHKLEKCLSILGIEGNNVTRKSNMLIWFNNLAILRNKTKGHGSITPAECSQVCTILDDSLSCVVDNLGVFNRPWAFLHQNMSGKYRVSMMGGDAQKFHHLTSSTNYTYPNGIYCVTDSVHQVSLMYSDELLSNFSFVNGNFSSEQFEIIDYLTNKRKKQDGSNYVIPPVRLPDSITAGTAELGVLGDSFTNLPSGISDYIKRSELESDLKRVLLYEDRYPIVTLKGRGGIGKTSLAIEVINQIIKESPERFNLIVWFSSRDVDLLLEGPKQVHPNVISQKDISVEFFNQVESEKRKSKQVIEEFSKVLSGSEFGKVLFIFDNFETLANPIETFEWIDSFIRLPNKILITSRMNRNFKADYPVEVSGMTDSQCRELINLTAKRLGIVDKLTEKYINSVIEESDGHPYIIKVILGEACIKGNFSSPMRVVAKQDAVLEALFKRTYSTLSKASKRVFLVLCSWRSVIPQIALESVLLREDNERIDLDNALEELNKSSFVDIVEREDDSFISVPMAASLFGKKELDVSPDKMAILRDKKLLVEFGAGTSRGFHTLKAHLQRKITTIRGRIRTESDLNAEIPSLECLAQRYPPFWIDIANLYHDFNLFENEKESIRELIKTTSDVEVLLVCWKRLSLMAQNEGNWKEESAAFMEILSLSQVPYEEISYIAYRINRYYSENDDRDLITKNTVSNTCKRILVERISEANSVDCSRLAWLCLNLTDEVNALEYAQLGLEKDATNMHCQNLVSKLSGKRF